MKETGEDLRLIKECILLPLVIKVFERDMKLLENSHIKLKEPYIDAVQRAIEATTKELARVKRECRQRGIRVYEQERTVKSLNCRYVCRGYHDSFDMLWWFVKSEVRDRMKRFLSV